MGRACPGPRKAATTVTRAPRTAATRRPAAFTPTTTACAARTAISARTANAPRPFACDLLATSACRSLETFDVDLPHLEHRLRRARRHVAIAMREELEQAHGDDLPRETELVAQPAAAVLLAAAREELLPQTIDLGLRLASHEHRKRGRVRVVRAAVERDEATARERERHHHRRDVLDRRF